MSDTINTCPCGSQIELNACCLPIIQGKKKAETALDLLRARYTAFTRGDVSFILDSHHSSTRHEVNATEIEEWAKDSQWLGLKVAQMEAGGKSDDRGTILFVAEYHDGSQRQEHWEKSFFERENGDWKFLDAQSVHVGTYQRTEPKIGRNDPCPCGSGKKFKKCCA
jgi:SEC-C motif-containing protein